MGLSLACVFVNAEQKLTYYVEMKGKGKVIPLQTQCGPEGG